MNRGSIGAVETVEEPKNVKPYKANEFPDNNTPVLEAKANSTPEAFYGNMQEPIGGWDSVVARDLNDGDMLAIDPLDRERFNIPDGDWVPMFPRSDKACSRDGLPSQIDAIRRKIGNENVRIPMNAQGQTMDHIDCTRIYVPREFQDAVDRRLDREAREFVETQDASGTYAERQYKPSDEMVGEVLRKRAEAEDDARRRGYIDPTHGKSLAEAMEIMNNMRKQKGEGYITNNPTDRDPREQPTARGKSQFAMGAGLKNGKLVRQ